MHGYLYYTFSGEPDLNWIDLWPLIYLKHLILIIDLLLEVEIYEQVGYSMNPHPVKYLTV